MMTMTIQEVFRIMNQRVREDDPKHIARVAAITVELMCGCLYELQAEGTMTARGLCHNHREDRAARRA
jgi:hypothetical protein